MISKHYINCHNLYMVMKLIWSMSCDHINWMLVWWCNWNVFMMWRCGIMLRFNDIILKMNCLWALLWPDDVNILILHMRVVLKEYYHAISKKIILWIYKGLVSYCLYYVMILNKVLNTYQKWTIAWEVSLPNERR